MTLLLMPSRSTSPTWCLELGDGPRVWTSLVLASSVDLTIGPQKSSWSLFLNVHVFFFPARHIRGSVSCTHDKLCFIIPQGFQVTEMEHTKLQYSLTGFFVWRSHWALWAQHCVDHALGFNMMKCVKWYWIKSIIVVCGNWEGWLCHLALCTKATIVALHLMILGFSFYFSYFPSS